MTIKNLTFMSISGMTPKQIRLFHDLSQPEFAASIDMRIWTYGQRERSGGWKDKEIEKMAQVYGIPKGNIITTK